MTVYALPITISPTNMGVTTPYDKSCEIEACYPSFFWLDCSCLDCFSKYASTLRSKSDLFETFSAPNKVLLKEDIIFMGVSDDLLLTDLSMR